MTDSRARTRARTSCCMLTSRKLSRDSPRFRNPPHIAARTFQSKTDSSVRVTVVMANRLALEEQTGAQLIYFNETYRSFVMVQYKALEKGDEEAEFRWTDGDQFTSEIQRIDNLLAELQRIEPDADPRRIPAQQQSVLSKILLSESSSIPTTEDCFPADPPHGFWKALAASQRLKGPRGGNLLTYANVGRKLSGSEFTTLVAGSWVGTTIGQSASLERFFGSAR